MAEGQGREGDAGRLPEGTAPAGVPGQLRGTGPAGAAGGTELRAVPAGAGAAGVPGAAEQAGGAVCCTSRGCRWRRAGRRWT